MKWNKILKKNLKPKISVIIPSYLHAHLISRAIDSVLNQTYTNWEIIVVDNFSDDGTNLILKKYMSQNYNIAFYRIKNNGIIAKSRNYGIRKANGDFIAFLDADDWWTDDKLANSVNAINNGFDFIYHNAKVISPKKNIFNQKLFSSKPKSPLIINFLIHGVTIPNSSVVVRKSVLEDINYISEETKLIGVEDQHTWLRISIYTDSFCKIDKILGFYWSDEFNNSKPSSKLYDKFIYLHTQFYQHLSAKETIRAEAFLNYKLGRVAFQIGDYSRALNHYLKSIKSNLTHKYLYKAFIFIIISFYKKIKIF